MSQAAPQLSYRPVASFSAVLAALFVAAAGQHDGQVLQRGGQFHRRTDRPVMRHRLLEEARIDSSSP